MDRRSAESALTLSMDQELATEAPLCQESTMHRADLIY
jgi:hypothetical protein